MCNLKHPVSEQDPEAAPGMFTGKGVLPPGPIDPSTKFAKLLRVALPIMQGGLDAAIANTSSPAATAAKAEQSRAQMIPLQQQELQERIRSQRAEEVYREAEAKRAGQALSQNTKSLKKPGDDSFYEYQFNPKTGDYDKKIGLSREQADRTDRPEIINSKQGIFARDPVSGKTNPVTTQAPGIPDRESPIPGMMEEQPTPPQMPLEPIAQERVEDTEAKSTEPHPTAVTDSDEKGVSTTHFIDTNPRSKTYMQDIKGGRPAATRFPKPGTTKADPARVQHYAEEFMQRAGDKADVAIRTMNALKSLPDGDKQAIEKRIREMAKPAGPKKTLLEKYGIDLNKPPTMPTQPGR